jgi:putative protease
MRSKTTALETGSRRAPEILAPAGDRACLEAAVHAGADAVYFGLQGFNARARATNFDAEGLAETLEYLHRHGVRGYVTLNTLIFDDEVQALSDAVRCCEVAGVDAIIVQDIGCARLAKELAPSLPLHASTQMTCTDADAIEFARELGASRIILARELSLTDIAAIRRATDAELEVFVHGALCIAYSGQCLTSEAIGGRSANRGACAQSCRLPYELVVDGVKRDLGDKAYLLSPEDLEASALVPELCALGVASLKIEGRLKGPEYVAATTALYRKAVDAAIGRTTPPSLEERTLALQTFSRGSGPGFLAGVDHQRLVEGRSCDHRGLQVGTVSTGKVGRRGEFAVRLSGELARGDGLLVEGGLASAGEFGGRVWALQLDGEDVPSATAGQTVTVWFGPDRDPVEATAHRRVFKTNDPAGDRRARAIAERGRRRLDLRLTGVLGEPALLEGWSGSAYAAVALEGLVERAKGAGLRVEDFQEKLEKLGDTPFELGELSIELPEAPHLALSALNRGRRALVEALADSTAAHRVKRTGGGSAMPLRHPLPENPGPEHAPPAGLFVLCRNLPQAEAALEAGADGIYLDFLELTGTGKAVAALRAKGSTWLGLAPPRIRKPGEDKIDRYLESLAPDAMLVRGLGALRSLGAHQTIGGAKRCLFIGDFSLNVVNRLSAREVLSRGVAAFTPSFDLDATQLTKLLADGLGPFTEVVVHHPMALFHMEHCVIAALLSDGTDHLTCGRPCERHQLSVRDRAGMDHPVEADVGCRNTVFHARPQSAADLVPALDRQGVKRFRVELVREAPDQVGRVVTSYRKLLAKEVEPRQLWRELGSEQGYGVVRGSLRVLA